MEYLDKWGCTLEALDQMLVETPLLRGMLWGNVAERRLRADVFEGQRAVTGIVKPADSNRTNHADETKRLKGDLFFKYKGHEFKLESKTLDTDSVVELGDGTYAGTCQSNASDRRNLPLPNGEAVNCNLLVYGQFDIFAVCLFAFGDRWHWAFAKNKDLACSPRQERPKKPKLGDAWVPRYTEEQRKYLIASSQRLSYPLPENGIWHSEPWPVLDSIIEDRSSGDSPEQTMPVALKKKLEERGELPQEPVTKA